jgi:hypothetical protein
VVEEAGAAREVKQTYGAVARLLLDAVTATRA